MQSAVGPKAVLGYVDYGQPSSYLADWLDGFHSLRALQARSFNLARVSQRKKFIRESVDAELIVVLHSALMDNAEFLTPVSSALQSRSGKLVVFVGNEYNVPWAPMGDKIAWIRSVGADIVATQLLQSSGDWLYQETGARILSLPHALNPGAFYPDRTKQSVRVFLGTITFPYPLYLGDNSRMTTLDRISAGARRKSLSVDVRTDRRLDRAAWAAFLRKCQWTVATEAGANCVDRDDKRAFAIRDFVASHRRSRVYRPDGRLRSILRRLPWSWKETIARAGRRIGVEHESHEHSSELYEEVIRRFFIDWPNPAVLGKCVSARHFDAIGTETPQILLQGRYNDILLPNVHYLSLKSDFSNIEETLDAALDPRNSARIVAATSDLVSSGHTIEDRLNHLLRFCGVGP